MNTEPVIAQGIIFSDTVIREHVTGKLSYIGSFQNYNLAQMPSPVPPFVITALITNLEGVQNINVAVRLDHKEKGITVASSGIGVGFTQPPKRNQVFEISIPMPGLVFPEPGIYVAAILVNTDQVGQRELIVQQITSTTP